MIENSPSRLNFPTSAPECERVYLLHGFAACPVQMLRIARRLQQHGYAIRNWGYPSLRRRIAFLADQLREDIEEVAARQQVARIHFITYSLGSIVLRKLLTGTPPVPCGRIVMIAPPNRGSHVARWASTLLRGLCPVLRELSDAPSSLVNQLNEFQSAEVGIIGGSGDWVVRQRSTHLPHEQDHLVVRGGHLSLPFLKTCADQSVHFLQHGRFYRLNGQTSSFQHQAASVLRTEYLMKGSSFGTGMIRDLGYA